MAKATSIPERIRDTDPERRYRSVLLLDPDRELDDLLACLSDESWRVRKAAVRRIAEAKETARAVHGLVCRLADADDAGARNAAAETLVSLGKAASATVSECLASPDADVRKFAADILGEIRDPSTVPALIAALSDTDGNVRCAAAEALGKSGGPSVAGALEDVLSRDDRMLRLAALDALSLLGQAPPVPVLAPLAKDSYLRRAVLRLLGWAAGRGALELIAEGLQDKSKSAREAAFAGLAQQVRRSPGAQQALAQLCGRAARSSEKLAVVAREALHAETPATVEGAMRVLGLTGDPQDARTIVEAAAGREGLREVALEALRGLGASAGPALLAALPCFTPEARLEAVRALSVLRERSALSELLRLAREGGEEERGIAVDALGAFGDPSAIAPLSDLLEEPLLAAEAARALLTLAKVDRQAVREACRARLSGEAAAEAMRVLGQIGGPEDVARLKAGLRSERTEVRLAATEAAQALGEAGTEELLRLALADEAPEVRAGAARGLGTFNSEETLRALREALGDTDPSVAAAAAGALGTAGDLSAVELLENAVSRGNAAPGTPEVLPAIAAVRALLRLGTLSLEVLRRAAGHGDPEVIKEAISAAEALPGTGELLLSTARHARWDVRRASARAIAARGERALLSRLRELAAAEDDSLAAEAFAESIRILEARPARD